LQSNEGRQGASLILLCFQFQNYFFETFLNEYIVVVHSGQRKEREEGKYYFFELENNNEEKKVKVYSC